MMFKKCSLFSKKLLIKEKVKMFNKDSKILKISLL